MANCSSREAAGWSRVTNGWSRASMSWSRVITMVVSRLKNLLRSRNRREAPLRERAQPRDVLGARDAERNGGAQRFQQQLGRQRLFRAQRAVERGDHGLFDLGAAESLARRRKARDVELRDVLLSRAEVNREDRRAFGGRRQVDEEDLVEAAFAQKLRRQAQHVVRGADDE